MSFGTALSGLNAASTELSVISNNVANASTNGFKVARTEFADVFASSNLGSSSNAVGNGVKVASVTQQFTQGNIEYTNNSLDLAISGQGFFRLDQGGTIVYSRAGAFGVDKDGYVVNAQGQRLTGYLADNIGNVTGALGAIQLDTSNIAPKGTSAVKLGLNLDASASIPFAPVASSAITLSGSGGGAPVLDSGDSPVLTPAFSLVDGYGQQVTGARLQFTNTGGNNWDVNLIGAGGTATTASFTIGSSSTVTLNWDPDGAGAQSSIPLTFDVSGLTQVSGGGGTSISAKADGTVQGAFDPATASSFNNSTSLTVYDSLGSSHLATIYYRKTGIPNQWESYLYVDGARVSGAQPNGSDLLQFRPDGSLLSLNGQPIPPTTITMSSFNPGTGAAPVQLSMDYSSISQYGGGFNVASLSQDGYATGRLSGIDIDKTGVMLARFTNGQSRTIAQVALVNFSNPQGLTQLGDSSWAESFSSGAPLIGTPGSSSLGQVDSGALEASNVDLTAQLVEMITAQRNFQANAQVIQTTNAITQTIINLRG
jgi:flagellar hook protein FlgE